MSICSFSGGRVYISLPDPKVEGKNGFVSINGIYYPYNSENHETDLAIWTPEEGWVEDHFALLSLKEMGIRTLDVINQIVDLYSSGQLKVNDDGISYEADRWIVRAWEEEIGNVYKYDFDYIALNPEEWLIRADGNLAKPIDGFSVYTLREGDHLITRRVSTHGFDPVQWDSLNLAQKAWFLPQFSVYRYIGKNRFDHVASNTNVFDPENIRTIVPMLSVIDDDSLNSNMLKNYSTEGKLIPIQSLAVTSKEQPQISREVYYEASLPLFFSNGKFTLPHLIETTIGVCYKLNNNDVVNGWVQAFNIEGSPSNPGVIVALFEDVINDNHELGIDELKNSVLELIQENPLTNKIFYPE